MRFTKTPTASKRFRATLAAAAAVTLASTLAACGAAEEGGSDDEIVIGISLPLTGDFSEPGKGVQRGYEAWAAYVNDNGGLLGRDVRLRDPRRPVQRRPCRRRLREADQPGAGRPDRRSVLHPPGDPGRPGRPGLRLPLRRACRRGRPRSSRQGFDNLFYAAPAVADDHYNLLAEHILAMPEAERPKTAAYASMDDPFAQGTAYGLKEALEEGGIETVVDEVYPPNTTDFSSIAAKIADTKADIVVGGTPVPGRCQPDRRAAAAQLPAQDGGVLDRADRTRVRRGDRGQDRGHPRADRLHPRTRTTPRTRSS